MTKLTNGQLVTLSNARGRDDGAVDLPKHLKGGAVVKVVKPLLKMKLLKEIPANSDMPVWRHDEKKSRTYALIITQAGRDAIESEPGPSDGEDVGQRQPDKIKPSSDNEWLRPTKRSANSSAAPAPRIGSKLALVVKMLGRVHGVSIKELTKATDWLPHTTRAVITSLRNKGYQVKTERNQDKKTIYRIIAAGKAASHRKAA